MAVNLEELSGLEADSEPYRDNVWLAERLRLLWDHHFADVPIGFPISTRFGTRARYRFGSIAARNDADDYPDQSTFCRSLRAKVCGRWHPWP